MGIEITTTDSQVRALDNIHLAHMPYSHSIAATIVPAFTVWLVVSRLLKKPAWELALTVAVSSHIILDLATHVNDIALAPVFETQSSGRSFTELRCGH